MQSTGPDEAEVRKHAYLRSLRRNDWLAVACLFLLLIGYAIFLWHFYAPAISHPDANGYWAQGTMIADTGRATFRPESPAQYIGMQWLVTDSGLHVSRYPPGLPMAIALIARLFGPEASVLLNPILAVLTLLGVFLLARMIAGAGWGTLAAAMLALNPVFNTHALNSISHMAVAALLVWGIYLLMRWAENGSLLRIFGAGLLLGCIPTVRYPEALFAAGVAVFIFWHRRVRRRIWLSTLVAVVGALLPIIPLLIRNQVTFGAFWRTAYALTHEQTGFGWSYFQQHWLSYIQSLMSDGVGALLPLAVLGVALMIALPARDPDGTADAERSRLARPFGALAALLIVPTVLLYMAYYWGGMGMGGGGGADSMRFLMPLFPLFCVTAVWTLRLLTEKLGRAPRVAAVAALMAVYALWAVPNSLQECRSLWYRQEVLARATAALRANVPAGDVVMADQNLLRHLDFIRAWRVTDLARNAQFGMRGGRLQPAADDETPRPIQPGRMQERTARYENLSGKALEKAVKDDLQAWAGDGNIWFVGSESQLENMTGAYFNPRSFEIVARVGLPDPPQQMNMADRRGMFGARRPTGGNDPRGTTDALRATNRRGAWGDRRASPTGGQPDAGRGVGPGMPPVGGAPGMPGGMPPMGGAPGMPGGMFPMGGMGGMGGDFRGEKELVIAKWTGESGNANGAESSRVRTDDVRRYAPPPAPVN